jgi:hypothetical protein
VERQILLKGFAASRVEQDYGLDLMMHTFNERGEIESGHVFFQLKATDQLNILKDGETISLRVERVDVQLWQREAMPVILVMYDGRKDKAYWLYVQHYLEERNVSFEDLSLEQDRVTIRMPMANRLNRGAIEKFREFRNQLISS